MVYAPAILALIAGMIVGQFLNACAYQMALDRPCWHFYRCPACGTRLSLPHMVPVFSWLSQRGRTLCCDTRLDSRYLWTDLLLGLLFAGIWLIYPPLPALAYSVMTAGLFLATLVDLDHWIIPDRCSLGGIPAALLSCLLCPALMGEASSLLALRDSLIGAGVAAGVMWLMGFTGKLIVGRDGLGFGDVKLMGALGAFLGCASVPWMMMVSALLSLLVVPAVMLSCRSRDTAHPFGPFIAAAALAWIFGGHGLSNHFFAGLHLIPRGIS